jgi:hypothetical protein
LGTHKREYKWISGTISKGTDFGKSKETIKVQDQLNEASKTSLWSFTIVGV